MMKRIGLIFSLAMIPAAVALAQTPKNVDLTVSLTSPSGNYDDQITGAPIEFIFQLQNLGTDSVTTSDTLVVWIDTKILGETVYKIQSAVGIGLPPVSIAPGSTQSVTGFVIHNGEDFYGGMHNPVKFPDDAKVCPVVAVYGYSKDDLYFNDPGFDGQAYNNARTIDQVWTAFSGNNKNQETITFGSGATDLCSPTGVKPVLKKAATWNVYPNPASGKLNVDFVLPETTNASIYMRDITGRIVYRQHLGKINMGDHRLAIDLSGLGEGLYFIELDNGNKRSIRKVSIQK